MPPQLEVIHFVNDGGRVARRLGGTWHDSASLFFSWCPDALSVEMDTETYWRAFSTAIGKVMKASGFAPADVKALGLSAQGETLVVADKTGRPLRHAIVWLDNRAQSEADELGELLGHRHAYETTGQVRLVPTWPAAKVLWLRRHEAQLFEKVDKFILIEDYFLHRLTGEYVCEGSLVTSTCYWNFRTRKWWPEMLKTLGITAAQLPRYSESGVPVGKLLPKVAEELGLSPQTVACTGALDQACGAIGVGNIRPGIFSENTGAALAICATVSQPTLGPDNQMPCHYHGVPDLYMLHTSNMPEGHQVRMEPLGYLYDSWLGHTANQETENPNLDDQKIIVNTWELYPALETGDIQEIHTSALQGDTPLVGVELVLEFTLPDGNKQQMIFPATDANGQAYLTLKPIDARTYAIVPYQVCLLWVNQEHYCHEDSFIIINNVD